MYGVSNHLHHHLCLSSPSSLPTAPPWLVSFLLMMSHTKESLCKKKEGEKNFSHSLFHRENMHNSCTHKHTMPVLHFEQWDRCEAEWARSKYNYPLFCLCRQLVADSTGGNARWWVETASTSAYFLQAEIAKCCYVSPSPARIFCSIDTGMLLFGSKERRAHASAQPRISVSSQTHLHHCDTWVL